MSPSSCSKCPEISLAKSERLSDQAIANGFQKAQRRETLSPRYTLQRPAQPSPNLENKLGAFFWVSSQLETYHLGSIFGPLIFWKLQLCAILAVASCTGNHIKAPLPIPRQQNEIIKEGYRNKSNLTPLSGFPPKKEARCNWIAEMSAGIYNKWTKPGN